MAKILIADDRQLMRSVLKTVFAMRPKWEVAERPQTAVKPSQKFPNCGLTSLLWILKCRSQMASKPQGRFPRLRPSFQLFMYTLYRNDALDAAAKQAGVRSVVSKQDGILNLLEAIDAELPDSK
jgi:DNA-binding NarL/FixJ family response regulator